MRVPVYEQQIETPGLPNTRQALDTRGAFGGEVAQALGQAAGATAKAAIDIKERDDNAMVKQSMSEFRRQVNARQYTDEDAYFTRKGQRAYQSLSDQMKSLEELRKLSVESLTPDQSMKFNQVAQEYLDREHGQMSNYARTERSRWLDDEDTGVIEAAAEDGSLRWRDNTAYEGQIRASVRNKATRNGWSQEQIDNETKAQLTTMHVTALENILQQQPAEAAAYFEQHKDNILAKFHDDILARIAKKNTDDAAMVAADAASAFETEAQARQYLKDNVANAEVRKAATGLIADEYRARERETNRRAVEAYGQAVDHVLGGGSAAQWAIDNAAAWDEILPDKQRALMSGFDLQTHLRDYYEAKGMIMGGDTDGAWEIIAKGRINGTDSKKLIDQMLKPPLEQRNVLTDKTAFDKTVQAILAKRPTGKKSGEEWDRKYNVLSGVYQQRIDEWFESNPNRKVIPHEERQKILDAMQIEGTLNRRFWFDEDITLRDIPAADLELIRDALTAEGYPVTPENIMRKYLLKKERE